MLKVVTALCAATVVAIGVSALSPAEADCTVSLSERDGQVIEQVVCTDGSFLEVAHAQVPARESEAK